MSNFAKTYKKNLDTVLLSEALIIANELQVALAQNNIEKLNELESKKEILLKLLEYILSDLLNPKIDPYLLEFILKYFGIKLPTPKISNEAEKEENRIKKSQKDALHRLIIYEIYKVLCPNRLAGETEIDNFINNSRTRGIEYAIKHSEPELGKIFSDKVNKNLKLQNIDSKKSFVETVENDSKIPSGRTF